MWKITKDFMGFTAFTTGKNYEICYRCRIPIIKDGICNIHLHVEDLNDVISVPMCFVCNDNEYKKIKKQVKGK